MSDIINTIKKIRNKLRHLAIGHLTFEHQDLQKELEQVKLMIGKHEARLVSQKTYKNIQDAEFKVFSQFGSDGIIQYLIQKVKIPNKTFIEFGVGDYSESNTRFLLMNNNWKGLIIDMDSSHQEYLKSNLGKDIFYRHDITAVTKHLTLKNINQTFADNGFTGDIGLLCIDVDSIDYWMLEAISAVSPRILIVEYNSTFGDKYSVTVPNKDNFDREKEHYSHLYFGASLRAIVTLAKKKGYVFIGSNSAGTDAFFLRRNVSKGFLELTAEKGYSQSMFRESFNQKGEMSYISSHTERLKLIRRKKVYETTKKQIKTIAQVYGLKD